MGIVEFAAWLFVGKTAGGWLTGNWGAQKRRRLENMAARAEYKDSLQKEYLASWDESQTTDGASARTQQRERERNLERQRYLLMRYPSALVELPAGKYFAQAEEEDRAINPPFRERLKVKWKWWLLALISAMTGYFLSQVARRLF